MLHPDRQLSLHHQELLLLSKGPRHVTVQEVVIGNERTSDILSERLCIAAEDHHHLLVGDAEREMNRQAPF